MTYEALAKELAQKAGDIIRKNFQLGMKKEWKADNSPVTATDIEVNKLVIEEVKKHFPGHDIKGEEESSLENNSEYLWVCDPVDGTYPFSHGLPNFAFSLALVKDGEPILGIANDPILNRVYFAEKGKGAFLNDEKIHVSDLDNLNGGIIDAVNFKAAKYQMWDIYNTLANKGSRLFKLGSIVYAGVLVACGEFTATIFTHVGCHDIAALKIIVEEAGGKVTDLFGKEQRYDREIKGAIISNGKVHDELVTLVGESLGIN